MEKSPVSTEGQKENVAEKKSEIIQKVHELHEYYAAMQPLEKEWMRIANQPKYKEKLLFGQEFKDQMTEEDKTRIQEIDKTREEFNLALATLIKESAEIFLGDEDVSEWERMPEVGVEGSLARENWRRYRKSLDNDYFIELRRYDIPTRGQFRHPSGEHMIDYAISIEGSKKVKAPPEGILRRREDVRFPCLDDAHIRISVLDNGQLLDEGSKVFLNRFFEKEDLEDLKNIMAPMGEKLKETLG